MELRDALKRTRIGDAQHGVAPTEKAAGAASSESGCNHAAATTSCHACMADALKARCVLADVRWRWTLNVL